MDNSLVSLFPAQGTKPTASEGSRRAIECPMTC
jgi:hypothetical protein